MSATLLNEYGMVRYGTEGMGGKCPPNPSAVGSWELSKSEEKKIGGVVGGGTGSSWPNRFH